MTSSTSFAEDFLPPTDKQFFGPGSVCQLLQVTLPQLRTLMEQTDVRFAACLDGVGLLDADGLQKVVDKAAELRAEISDKLSAAENN